MLEKLKNIAAEHEELSHKLSMPEIINNREKYLELSRRYAELSTIVELFRTYEKTKSELDGAEEIAASETDPELQEMAISEIDSLRAKLDELESKIKVELIPPDPFDGKNIILEIRAGTGGAEAGLFAADLLRMYSRFAEEKGWKTEILSESFGELDGIKEVIVLIAGNKVYGTLKHESGVHRVQRVPVTEASGRIHTSAVTVAVLPEADDVELDVDPAEIKVDVYRSSGPGGQSVNTTDSAVRLTHIPTGLIVTCQDEKSQHKNKAKALKILKSRLLDMARREQDEKIARERKLMVSTGDRSAKIRTYNFPQNRISDHRINLTLHKLALVLEGDLDELIDALQTYYQTEQLQSGSHT